MKNNYSKSLIEKIEETYTYSFCKNTGLYQGKIDKFNSVSFFDNFLKDSNPFKAFMKMSGYGYKNAKKAILRYGISYTKEEEQEAKVFEDVVQAMNNTRSDYVSIHIENYEGTEVVLYKEPFIFTTEDTIYVKNKIKELSMKEKTQNVLFREKLPKELSKSKEQINALETCLQNKISCLIGGAGTGKSFVTAAIINQLILNHNQVAVLAPTHKAREALQDKLDYLNVNSVVKTIQSFVHNPTYCDAIVIDESGMLSTETVASLFKHAYKNQQIIFAGDKNQLEPIGYGRPFELILEKFPTAELKVNRRAEVADIIALGREILGDVQNANMEINNIEVVDTVEEAFNKKAEVVLAYQNKIVDEINEKQKIKNGQRTIAEGFSVGDKIVATTNSKNRFYNGQLFTITGFDTAVRDGKDNKIIYFENDKDLKFNFKLAYGLTVHKSQGSEWDVVAYQPGLTDTQNLAYVAVTRAKKKLIIIGEMRTSYLPNREWRHIV